MLFFQSLLRGVSLGFRSPLTLLFILAINLFIGVMLALPVMDWVESQTENTRFAENWQGGISPELFTELYNKRESLQAFQAAYGFILYPCFLLIWIFMGLSSGGIMYAYSYEQRVTLLSFLNGIKAHWFGLGLLSLIQIIAFALIMEIWEIVSETIIADIRESATEYSTYFLARWLLLGVIFLVSVLCLNFIRWLRFGIATSSVNLSYTSRFFAVLKVGVTGFLRSFFTSFSLSILFLLLWAGILYYGKMVFDEDLYLVDLLGLGDGIQFVLAGIFVGIFLFYKFIISGSWSAMGVSVIGDELNISGPSFKLPAIQSSTKKG